MFAVAPLSARWRAAVLMAVCVGFAVALPVHAQDATPPPAEPPADSSAAATPVAPVAAPAAAASAMPALAAPLAADRDSALALPVLFEPRPAAAIEAEVQLMTRLQAESLQRFTDFKQREANKAAQAEAKKADMASASQQISLAKKEKRAADQKALEKQRRQLDMQERFLERLRELYGARVESEQATADYAAARIAECKAELKLNNLGVLTSPAIRKSAATRMALNEMNDALKLRAGRMATAASKEQALVNKRQAALDAFDDMFK
jgi:type IV secretory pathway VirB10-like protein